MPHNLLFENNPDSLIHCQVLMADCSYMSCFSETSAFYLNMLLQENLNAKQSGHFLEQEDFNQVGLENSFIQETSPCVSQIMSKEVTTYSVYIQWVLEK